MPQPASRDDHTSMTSFQQSPHSVAPDVPNMRLPVSSDDTGDGLLVFVVFIAAALTSTVAVVLIALADEWWVLGFGFAIHVMVTAIVMLTIVQTMGGRRAGSERAGQSTMASARRDQPSLAEGARTGAGTHREPPPRRRAAAQASPLESGGSLRMARRVLVVTDETLAPANEVPQPILDHVEEADEVYVVAPTLATWLQSLTGDIDGARASADERLRTVFDHMDASGLEFHGTVGDEDQVAAIADALDGFSADLILLRLHAQGSRHENWREHRLVDWVRTHTTVPTIVFYFDDDGQFVRPEDAIESVADPAGQRES
jgi:hypothetical protein